MPRGGFATSIDDTGEGNSPLRGLDKALTALRRLKELGGNLLPFMEDAKTILVKSTLNRFQTGRGVGGIPWAPTKRQVRSAVGATGPNKARILVDTGDLQGSIRGVATPNSVEVGSDGLKNPVKALANQFGSHRQTVVRGYTRKGTFRAAKGPFGAFISDFHEAKVRPHGRITNLPARPFVGIDAADVAEVNEAWQDRLIRTFGATNG